jgi:hypothetical protein
VHPLRAGFEAVVASYALPGSEKQLRVGGDGLGVMAPEAVEGATLEEDSGADTRAIVDRKVLDVEDGAGEIHNISCSSLMSLSATY